MPPTACHSIGGVDPDTAKGTVSRTSFGGSVSATLRTYRGTTTRTTLSGTLKVTNTGTSASQGDQHRHAQRPRRAGAAPARSRPAAMGGHECVDADRDEERHEQRDERGELIREDLLEDRQPRELRPGQPDVREPFGPADEERPEGEPDTDHHEHHEQPGEGPASAQDHRGHGRQRDPAADIVGRRPVATQVPAETHVVVGEGGVAPRGEEARERQAGQGREREEHSADGLGPGQPVPGRVREDDDDEPGGQTQCGDRVARPGSDLAPAHHHDRGQTDDAAKSSDMTKTSGEMKNCTMSSAASTTPSRQTVCSWRMTISCRVVNRSGGMINTVTDT